MSEATLTDKSWIVADVWSILIISIWRRRTYPADCPLSQNRKQRHSKEMTNSTTLHTVRSNRVLQSKPRIIIIGRDYRNADNGSRCHLSADTLASEWVSVPVPRYGPLTSPDRVNEETITYVSINSETIAEDDWADHCTRKPVTDLRSGFLKWWTTHEDGSTHSYYLVSLQWFDYGSF